MLDIKAVRQDPEGVASVLARRGFTFDVAAFESLDARRKAADMTAQGLQAERKSASKKIGELISQGMDVDEAKAQVNETLEKIAAQIDEATAEAAEVQAEIESLLLATPNLLDDSVPAGASEDDNIEVSRWGELRQFDFPVRDHVDIGEGLQLFDTATAGKITRDDEPRGRISGVRRHIDITSFRSAQAQKIKAGTIACFHAHRCRVTTQAAIDEQCF